MTNLARRASALLPLCALVALSAPAGAHAQASGGLAQLPGKRGCLVDGPRDRHGCTPVRALDGPAPFLGSNAVAISPDGRHVYVASSRSDAIAVFSRSARTGALTQRQGAAGCIAADGADRCAAGVGLDGPNSVAVSPDGRSVYATSLHSDAVLTFHRDPSTGALAQAGCVAGQAIPGCTPSRTLDGADVVVVSGDGRSVYVGAFAAGTVTTFERDAATGALTQVGCLADTPTEGCATGLALGAPEGLAVSADGAAVYVAAARGNALAVLARDPSNGALTQAADGSGCIVDRRLAGCTTGRELAGANAVAIASGDGGVYVTSLLSASLTGFDRASDGRLTQMTGYPGCVTDVPQSGCQIGRALGAPEGVAVSPDGARVYVAAFKPGAVAVFTRDAGSGSVRQARGRLGCVTARPTRGCRRGRAVTGVGAIAVSPDGKHVYAAGFGSDSIAVFRAGGR